MFESIPGSQEYLKFIAPLLLPLILFMFYQGVTGIKQSVVPEDRDYKDELSRHLKLLWPLVRFFEHYVGEHVSVETIERYNRLLMRAGLNYLMTPEQLVGLRIVSALGVALFVQVCLMMLEVNDWFLVLLGLTGGFYLPLLKINDQRKQREKKITKALPVYLDYLTLAIQAGMNFSGAIAQAVEKGPEGPLNLEFAKITRDIRAGMSRPDALKAMSERLSLDGIHSFVNAILQAERTGASVGETLKIQADMRRIERFQKAEKQAMQAPVKLIFPLVAFIFPVTFLILGFPIGMELMTSLR